MRGSSFFKRLKMNSLYSISCQVNMFRITVQLFPILMVSFLNTVRKLLKQIKKFWYKKFLYIWVWTSSGSSSSMLMSYSRINAWFLFVFHLYIKCFSILSLISCLMSTRLLYLLSIPKNRYSCSVSSFSLLNAFIL